MIFDWNYDNADYVADPALLTNAPIQAESLLHSQEQTAGGTSLYAKANKAEFINLKQAGAISSSHTKEARSYLLKAISTYE